MSTPEDSARFTRVELSENADDDARHRERPEAPRAQGAAPGRRARRSSAFHGPTLSALEGRIVADTRKQGFVREPLHRRRIRRR